MPHSFSTGEVLARLEILHKKLEDEGSYVSSNTVWLAIEEIKRNPSDMPEDCPECGGEGFVFECFDGCCEDADMGCDDCTRSCSVCIGGRK